MDSHDPTQVVEALFAALSERRWRDAADLFTPHVLAARKEEVLSRHRCAMNATPVTREQIRERDPDLPEAVVDYFYEQTRRTPMSRRVLRDDVAGVESLEALEAMDRVEAFARSLEATDPGAQLERHVAVLKRQYPEHAEKLDHLGPEWTEPRDRRVVGTVVDGDHAWAVIRSGDDGLDQPIDVPPETVVLRRTSTGWRVSEWRGVNRRREFAALSVTGDDGRRVFLPRNWEEEDER